MGAASDTVYSAVYPVDISLCSPHLAGHRIPRTARPEPNRREVERFAARLETLAFDAGAADHAANIRAVLERRGQVIGGHARSRGLVVVTGNLGEFTRVDGLRCEDWEAT